MTKSNYISTEFIVSLLLIAAAVIVTLFMDNLYKRGLALIVIFVVVLIYFSIKSWMRQKIVGIAARIFEKTSEMIDKYVHAASIPTAITLQSGRIIWHNPAFFTLAGMQSEGKLIHRIFQNIQTPDKDKKIEINGKVYFKEVIPCDIDKRRYILYRFIDVENSYESAELYKIVLPVVGRLQIDNFDDLRRSTDVPRHMEIDAEIAKTVAGFASRINAVYQRYDRDKYMVIFERRYLSGIIAEKFSLLERIRRIDTGSSLTPTLSLGIGSGQNPQESNFRALKALEMALGRGGDQAVIKDDSGFKFYGGIQKGRERRTRVKVRTFANALRNLIEQCERVIIMGHNIPDLDCIGAALGLYACARSIRSKAYIVMDNPNASAKTIVDELYRNPDYSGVLLSPTEAENIIDSKTMLIIVDTQLGSFTIAPRLIKATGTIVVIDHHLRGSDYIDNAMLMLHEPYASSTCEMVTEVAQYFSDNLELKPIESEALLAGIMIDTKGFSFKTGARTFEAASYLRNMGADTTRVRHLFQDDLGTFIARSKVVESARVENGIAIAVCPRDINNPQLLTAQAADSLLGIRGIDASFVLCEYGGSVTISGRSLGDINVQRILEKIGGGGHATIAGAQLKGENIETAVDRLRAAIKEYEREV